MDLVLRSFVLTCLAKLNDRTNKIGSLRPPQPHASGSAGADGACLAGRKKGHPFVERAYVLLKFAGQRGVAPAICLVVQVGHLRNPLRKLSDRIAPSASTWAGISFTSPAQGWNHFFAAPRICCAIGWCCFGCIGRNCS